MIRLSSVDVWILHELQRQAVNARLLDEPGPLPYPEFPLKFDLHDVRLRRRSLARLTRLSALAYSPPPLTSGRSPWIDPEPAETFSWPTTPTPVTGQPSAPHDGYVALSERGGRIWECAAQADWERYVEVEYVPNKDNSHRERIAASDQAGVDRALMLRREYCVVIDDGSIRRGSTDDAWVRYWKSLPRVWWCEYQVIRERPHGCLLDWGFHGGRASTWHGVL